VSMYLPNAQTDTAIAPELPQVLTVAEVARALRCSKAHVHHLIAGRIAGVRPLPSLWLGRRRLVLRVSLNAWVRANEHHPEQWYDPITPG
jgi:Helix-turn-helix domain